MVMLMVMLMVSNRVNQGLSKVSQGLGKVAKYLAKWLAIEQVNENVKKSMFLIYFFYHGMEWLQGLDLKKIPSPCCFFE